jgi:hypothetical protein
MALIEKGVFDVATVLPFSLWPKLIKLQLVEITVYQLYQVLLCAVVSLMPNKVTIMFTGQELVWFVGVSQINGSLNYISSISRHCRFFLAHHLFSKAS